jgi:hypothetical protein
MHGRQECSGAAHLCSADARRRARRRSLGCAPRRRRASRVPHAHRQILRPNAALCLGLVGLARRHRHRPAHGRVIYHPGAARRQTHQAFGDSAPRFRRPQHLVPHPRPVARRSRDSRGCLRHCRLARGRHLGRAFQGRRHLRRWPAGQPDFPRYCVQADPGRSAFGGQGQFRALAAQPAPWRS